ncbi:hypothetical protein [Streptomyces sp. SID3343]|uniref:hypothetical protein n=1 Tax=Streptomyces sp. SID3343 TaxID=2690260 RepID=UPI00136830DA|nr:hypothetical protein [Streptomyces sp. SID3343]MYV98389.1 hypothetical protein [Streptomyces sp. SID3343]
MRDQLFRGAFHRPSMTYEPTIPWTEARETLGIAVWSANIRLSLVVPAVSVPWAIAGEQILDPTKVAFLLAMAGVAGRSAVGWTRLTRF